MHACVYVHHSNQMMPVYDNTAIQFVMSTVPITCTKVEIAKGV